MTPDFTDNEYPADPYPGPRPPRSYLHVDEVGYYLHPEDADHLSWRTEGAELDTVLRRCGEPPLQERLPVLAYGSNANPSKITWMRHELGMTGSAIVIRAQCYGISAVWAAGFRVVDDQRPAVIAAAPEVAEEHTVWFATPQQRQVLDHVEGRGERYRLVWLRAPIELDGGFTIHQVLAYTARPDVVGSEVPPRLNRSPLLVHGKVVRCADLGQEEARQLTGEPAETDGLDSTEVVGEP